MSKAEHRGGVRVDIARNDGGRLLLVRSDSLDRDERRACLRGDAVVSPGR